MARPPTGLGINEPIVFAPKSTQDRYKYRSGLGMVPSAEFVVFHDDFVQAVASNVPTGWTAAIIDTGGTATINTTAAIGANGVVTLADATASEGAAFYGSKSVQLTVGKKFFMEARLRTNDVTDNAVQFGLSALTATTNPEDLWTTAAADVIAMGILDGAATITTLTDAGDSGTSAVNTTGTLVADTWTTLAFAYDGTTLRFYKDGVLILTNAGVIPTGVALAPFIGHINGNGAGGNVVVFDYIRYSSER